MKAFHDDVRSLVELVDPELITARALREAVEAFGATEGSVYLRRAGRLELVAGSGVGTEGVMVSLPLQAQDQELGIIELGPRQSGRPYTGRDHEILEDLARQVAAAIALVGAPRSERTTAGPVT